MPSFDIFQADIIGALQSAVNGYIIGVKVPCYFTKEEDTLTEIERGIYEREQIYLV